MLQMDQTEREHHRVVIYGWLYWEQLKRWLQRARQLPAGLSALMVPEDGGGFSLWLVAQFEPFRREDDECPAARRLPRL